MKFSARYVITSTIVGILLSGCATETRIDPLQPIELGNLTFLSPSGEGWEYKRGDSSDIETALFARGGSGTPVFGVLVWQVHLNDPVDSTDDIWAGLLEPYRDVWNAQERGEINETQCNPDQTLTAVGLLCQVEGKADTRGMLNFWVRRLGPNDIVDAEGHVYAFVFPNDSRRVGVVEYFQQILPGVEPEDTRQLLVEFAQKVTIHE